MVDTLRRPGQRRADEDAGTPTISLPAPLGAPGHCGVVIEIVYLSVDERGGWHHRRVAEHLPTRTDPQRAAQRLAGIEDGDSAEAGADANTDADTNTEGRASGGVGAVMHSTSWRYDPAGHVVLTYAVLPDPQPRRDPESQPERDLYPSSAAKPLPVLEIARGRHHARPAPTTIGAENVAAHAIRHLAWLAGTDPVVAAALGQDEVVWRALAEVCPDPAGQLF